MTSQQENNHDTIAWTVSIVVHVLLLIAFIFMVAWREPYPPYPEYGIEVSFGIDDGGSGDVQPTDLVNTSDSEEESIPEDTDESTAEAVAVEDTPGAPVIESTPDSDVIEEKLPPEEAVETRVVKDESAEQSEIEEKESEKVSVNKPVLYEKKENNTTDGTDQTNDEVEKVSQGDHLNETGDKGEEDGSLDARTLYGDKGGGQGAPALDMSGWMWDFTPRPNDTSQETGRIVFEVKIDDEGEIISVRTLERSVSTLVEKIYRREIEKLTFTKISGSHSNAAVSTGTITFVIKSK